MLSTRELTELIQIGIQQPFSYFHICSYNETFEEKFSFLRFLQTTNILPLKILQL